jgi:hypothetical protein
MPLGSIRGMIAMTTIARKREAFMSAVYDLDPLESRTFLSATLSRHGVLYVVGTRRNDSIAFVLERRHRGFLDVIVNRRVQTFRAALVRQVIVQSGRGNDRVTFSDRFGRVPGRHFMYGGGGNDCLTGDGGATYIDGGGGSDTISGGIDKPPTPPPIEDPAPTDTSSDPTSSGPTTNPSDNSTGSDFNDPSSGGSSGGDFGDTTDSGESGGGDTGGDVTAEIAFRA